MGAFLRGEGSPNAKRGAPAPLVSRGFGVAPRALGGRGRYVTAPGGDLGSWGRGAAYVTVTFLGMIGGGVKEQALPTLFLPSCVPERLTAQDQRISIDRLETLSRIMS